MKKIAFAFFLLLAGAGAFFMFDFETQNPRLPASIPNNYEALSACEKQDILWNKVQATTYQELPEYRPVGIAQLVAMSRQELTTKGNLHSDFAPEGWKKYLHRRGALAKVKIVAKNNNYSGIFQGAECALLRLSLTYKTTKSRPVAPGLALKVLRDKTYSANISALVSLEGQGRDFNFFKYPMSNIVPMGEGIGQKIIHKIFRSVSHYPEELLANDMALIDSRGEKAANLIAPRQIFFVPSSELNFSSDEHDVRKDFLNIPEGSVIYQIHVVSDKYSSFNYLNYTAENVSSFLKDSIHVADIVTTSDFFASEFGDDGIFFRHQLRP